MMRSLFSAVSGLKNHQTGMDVIGNNISNVNTVGFKASRVIFEDIYSQTIGTASAPIAGTPGTGGINAKQIGLGSAVASVSTSINEGSAETTGEDLDFSIEGQGYFVIDSNGQTLYTRNGHFELDGAGNLVTSSGDFVMGEMGTALTGTPGTLEPIVVNPADYVSCTVDSNGVVTGIKKTDGSKEELGRLAMATFTNAAGLEKQGGSLYAASSNSGAAAVSYVNEGGAGSLKSGSLEMSNVDLANELTNMIIMQRGFQANSRVITTSDSMLEELVNLKR